MWIRTTTGNYINSEFVQKFFVDESKRGGYNIIALLEKDASFVARFSNEEDAQKYLDRMVTNLGQRIFKVDMEDWNYKGHKKDHKEIRGSGS